MAWIRFHLSRKASLIATRWFQMKHPWELAEGNEKRASKAGAFPNFRVKKATANCGNNIRKFSNVLLRVDFLEVRIC